MAKPLRVLSIEDSEDDVLLLARDLRRGGYTPQLERVETAAAMREALTRQPWDVILSDYSMPQFNAPAALDVLKASGLDIPFIIISGTIGEDTAVAALKAGAHDFIVKTNTARLLPAIERELREAENRRRRREAEEAIHQAEKRFRSLIEHSSDAIILMDVQGTILFGSPAITRLLGYSADRWVGRNGFEFVHADEVEELRRQYETFLQSDVPTTRFEARLMHRDGSPRWMELVISRFLAENNSPQVVVNFRDVTERKQAEAALRQYTERLKTLHGIDQMILRLQPVETTARLVLEFIHQQIGAARSSILLFDYDAQEARILAAHVPSGSGRAAGESLPLTIFSDEDILSLRKGQLYVIDDAAELPPDHPFVELLRAEGLRSCVCVPLATQDALLGVVQFGAARLALSADQIEIVREVADQLAIAVQQARYREQIERYTAALEEHVVARTLELQRAKEGIEAILNSSSDAIIMTSFDGVVQQLNPAFCDLFEYTPEEALGMSLITLVTVDSVESLFDAMYHVVNQRQARTIEVSALRKSGTVFDGDAALAPVLDGGRIVGMVCNLRDISERKQIERALQASEERYRALVEFAPDPIVIVNMQGQIVLVNQQVEATLGYAPAELVGQPVEVLVPQGARNRHVGHRASFMENPAARLMGENMDLVLLHRNRTELPVQVSLSPIQTGSEMLVMAYIIDISAHRQLEASLRAALERERELNQMKSNFVSMVSHDFRTPLTVIRSSADILESYFDRLDAERKANHFGKIRTQIERMVRLLDDVLTISRADMGATPFSPLPISLHRFCQGVVDEFQSMPTMQHTLIYTHADGPARVLVDEKLLHQALVNLLTNAFKYSPEGSEVQLDLAFDQEQAIISVRDQGIGIPEADQPRLFDTFHRASNVGEIPGTGLGLAIVKRSVEAHQGSIRCESQLGVGTKFSMAIPLRLPEARNS